jgi:hypothetical protein
MECALGLGSRMLRDKASTSRERIEHGFEFCLARRPSVKELDRLEQLFSDQQRLTSKPSTAITKVDSSETPKPAPTPDLPFVVVAQVLLNLDEFITRE